jgi:hypothetical protein
MSKRCFFPRGLEKKADKILGYNRSWHKNGFFLPNSLLGRAELFMARLAEIADLEDDLGAAKGRKERKEGRAKEAWRNFVLTPARPPYRLGVDASS